ncbi:MAG: hypothetical protein EAZ85_11260 [Bacteroidetes bacterium]|nr:MAG: hypothetical protein EAZ85_11260 [Bacteroidota bacterium]TAG90491.1 MAG: hypothetical protein EAZ20_04245 [Bacteroidota bacterium]
MEFILDKKSTTEGIVTVKVTNEDYAKELDLELKKAAKSVKINGFRPGKVPVQIVKQMYGGSIVSQLVFDKINKEVSRYMSEQDVHLVGGLVMSAEAPAQDWNKQKDFELVFDIAFLGDFELDLSAIHINTYTVEITDEELEEKITYLLERDAKRTETDIAKENSYLYFNIIKDNEQIHTIEKVTSDDFSDAYKTYFVGKSLNEEFVLKIKDVFNTENIDELLENLEDENVSMEDDLTFRLITIEDVEFNEMNEEYFKRLFPQNDIKTLEEFKEVLRKTIAHDTQELFDDNTISDLEDVTLSSIQVEVPTQRLKEWAIEAYVKTDDTGKAFKMTEAELEKEYSTIEKKVLWGVVLEKYLKTKPDFHPLPEDIIEGAIERLKMNMPYFRNMPKSSLKQFAIKQLGESKDINEKHEALQIGFEKRTSREMLKEVSSTNISITTKEYVAKIAGAIVKNHELTEAIESETEA